jgi:hypothetical protein
MEKTLYVVHCVDTEGPLDETLDATFSRLESLFGIFLPATKENLLKIQRMEIDFKGNEQAIANCFAPEFLEYNSDWSKLESMLDEILSDKFRLQQPDSFGNGWRYSWHCMDHMGFTDNPRNKDYGYGKVFRFYKSKLKELGEISDEINWHFHPLSITRNPTGAATSYINSYAVLVEIICRRILEDNWFPVVNRPGFHSERPDSHLFLEQWIPFDFANQFCEEEQDQPDASMGRFGDWRRAPKSWRGYHPSHDDYQQLGSCRRVIFRCLNIGTRMRSLTKQHVSEAFMEAETKGAAILAFANHDWRDMKSDIYGVLEMLNIVSSDYPDVKIKYAGAEEAATALLGYKNVTPFELDLKLEDNRIFVEVLNGNVFGPQPFLAIQSRSGEFYHDNLDIVIPRSKWTYIFDEQTLPLHSVASIGVGAAGSEGKYSVKKIALSEYIVN